MSFFNGSMEYKVPFWAPQRYILFLQNSRRWEVFL